MKKSNLYIKYEVWAYNFRTKKFVEFVCEFTSFKDAKAYTDSHVRHDILLDIDYVIIKDKRTLFQL